MKCQENLEADRRYLQYRNMVYKRARAFSRKWRMPFEDLECRGWEIFMNTLQKFDECRGCDFGTYLWAKLRALDDYAESQANRAHHEILAGDDWDFSSQLYESFVRRLEFYDCAATELSSNARMVLNYILEQGEKVYLWPKDSVGARKALSQAFGCTCKAVEDGWAELRDWWRQFDTGPALSITPVYVGCKE